jgi:hypothetical protein
MFWQIDCAWLKFEQLAFLTMTTIKTMWKAIFQNKLTIYKANLPSFVQKITKSRCYADLSYRLIWNGTQKWRREKG